MVYKTWPILDPISLVTAKHLAQNTVIKACYGRNFRLEHIKSSIVYEELSPCALFFLRVEQHDHSVLVQSEHRKFCLHESSFYLHLPSKTLYLDFVKTDEKGNNSNLKKETMQEKSRYNKNPFYSCCDLFNNKTQLIY